ncbi:MAG: hypothetical protein EOM73_02800, partial [Bacteroidia bacterium]|nr:hypothetical protein [Bacteroidia bacterium]
MASEANSLLQAGYNKLRYCYLSEQHILGRQLFSRFITTQLLDEPSYICQDASETDETIDDVVREKLESTYVFVDYKPLYSNFIDYWLESLYASGQITY